ncbi:hypothetical protein N0V90_008298 [Kalmusia sp. IMI 367209]|nr:hypothetical protein N0V90_008298 [Kalmusia sp. IMI 367209]
MAHTENVEGIVAALGATLADTLVPDVAVHCSPQLKPLGQQLPPKLAAQLYHALGQLPLGVATLAPLGAIITTPFVLTTVVLAVGRTGAEGAIVLVGSSPRQEAPVAQVRPFWQQPPPTEAGHENQPVEHVWGVDTVGVGEGEGEEDCVVGTTTTPVEEEARDSDVDVDVDVEGWIKVTDVATATPTHKSASTHKYHSKSMSTHIPHPYSYNQAGSTLRSDYPDNLYSLPQYHSLFLLRKSAHLGSNPQAQTPYQV